MTLKITMTLTLTFISCLEECGIDNIETLMDDMIRIMDGIAKSPIAVAKHWRTSCATNKLL